jgi:hypothetical protein
MGGGETPPSSIGTGFHRVAITNFQTLKTKIGDPVLSFRQFKHRLKVVRFLFNSIVSNVEIA